MPDSSIIHLIWLFGSIQESRFLSLSSIEGLLVDHVTVLPGGDGICFATVDPADIRGLATAFHDFVAELPQSSVGSWAWGPFP